MANINRHLFISLRWLLLAVALVMPQVLLTSCGNDEPDWLIGYYMTIDSQVRLSLHESDDESQGTSASPVEDVLSTTIVRMRTALHDAYPVNNYQGDDAGVITALDNIYYAYKSMYGVDEKNTVCVVKLYRASMDGEIVVKSTALKTYHFGARPPGFEE